jgi:ATPases involved in chromosome partitioning
MSKKIFVGNYKGGVGKTTSVFSIAVNMAKEGKRILLIDLDPQSSLSEICMRSYDATKTLKSLEPQATLNYIFDMYIRKTKVYKSIDLKFNLDMLIKECNSVSFIPSSLFYQGNIGLDELALQMENNVEYLSILKQFIDLVDKSYEFDYIFIDCPPSSNVITQGAFLMSDLYLIPTVLDGMSTNGVIHYINTINQTYKKYCEDSHDALFNKHFFGAKPKLIGIFYTLIRGQAKYTDDKRNFIKSLGELGEPIYIFDEYINNFVDIARNIAIGELSTTRSDYEKLTIEFISRLNAIE